ncbi:hypothetical protein SLS61_010227 [Didymella pomorum]
MSINPDKHDLLGFPGVKAEQSKIYLRRLWLPAENDRTTYPKFHDTDITEMARLAYKVINNLAKCNENFHKELQTGNFLRKDAERILEGRGYGRRIWGEDYGAARRLKSNLEGSYPRWGVLAASGGYTENDEIQ